MIDVSIVNIDPESRVATLGLSHKPTKGILKLSQIVVLSLLNVPGKDVLNGTSGGGIPEMIGMNFDPSDLSEVLSEFTRRVRKSEKEIIADQVRVKIPSDEKLKSLTVVSVSPGGVLDEVVARIRIINELGQQSDVVL